MTQKQTAVEWLEKEHKKPKFTDVEISHIVSVLMENEREGWYYGNKEQYWKRHQRILDKLLKQRQ